MPSREEWAQIKEMGVAALRSGMLPEAIKTPEAAAIIALKAYELGVPLMEGFSSIHVINGKPTIARELMQSLVYQNIQGATFNFIESTDKKCIVEGSRPGQRPLKIEFTIEDAARAQLLGKTVWKQYPKAMLLNRAVSALCRAYFPDGLRGASHTPEELEPTFETTGRSIEAAPVEVVADTTPQPPAPELPKPVEKPWDGIMSKADLNRLFAIAGTKEWSHENIREFIQVRWGLESTKQLNEEMYRTMLEVLELFHFDIALAKAKALQARQEQPAPVIEPVKQESWMDFTETP